MGKRGPQSRFDNVACPNTECPNCGQRGAGNIKGNGRYETKSGPVRKFVCSSCGSVFNERSGTAFYDLRSPDEKMLYALELVLRGMSLRATAGAMSIKLDTVRRWLAQAAAHPGKVNEALVRRVQVERVELDELWSFVRRGDFRAWKKARREMAAPSGSGLRQRPTTG